ncbi:MAG TPA: CRISPR-associated endonuclease Cas2 [Ktedonobacterales bacterium]|nr:CRISPR-associated endonuclease Cas2 [Ktedonobacterales bacterium]
MRCLLIYDIPDDRIRTRVSDACLDYGLERVQWSAFMGELNQTLQRELLLKVQNILGKKAAKVRLLPINEIMWQQQRVIEQGDPDVERITAAS